MPHCGKYKYCGWNLPHRIIDTFWWLARCKSTGLTELQLRWLKRAPRSEIQERWLKPSTSDILHILVAVKIYVDGIDGTSATVAETCHTVGNTPTVAETCHTVGNTTRWLKHATRSEIQLRWLKRATRSEIQVWWLEHAKQIIYALVEAAKVYINEID